MIESIYQIGKAVMQGSSGKRAFLESLAKAPPNPKKGSPSIAILKLNTQASTLDVEVRELSQHENNTVERFLWLGNAASSASDQDRLTTDGLHYLVSQTLPNLLSAITMDTPFYKLLTNVTNDFFIDIGNQDGLGSSDKALTYRRSRQILNLPKLQIKGPTLEELQQHVREKQSAKGLSKLIANALIEHFKAQLGTERMLFTLEVDGKLLIDNNEYLAYLENVYVGDVFENAQVGCCHLSSKVAPITSNLTRLKFKYYITDKLGFASGVNSSGFKSNLSISQDAYIALLAGERFIERDMGFYLAGTNGYILPNYYFGDMTSKTIANFLDKMRSVKESADINLGKQVQLDREIMRREVSKSEFSINLLFYKRVQASFKIVRLIQDVPEYRLYELRRAGVDIRESIANVLFGDNDQWELTLQKMYYLLPARKSGTDFYSRGVLEFYATLITGGLLDIHQLIQDFMELVRVYHFGTYAAYHISEPKDDSDYPLIRYVAQSSLLLTFLRAQNQLKEKNVSLGYLDKLDLSKKQREYLEKLHFSQEQAALYLLGVLVAEIANAQYKAGPGGKGGKKTILNKLNYQGMTINKVQQLSVDLFDKLRQYYDKQHQPRQPLLTYNEKIFAQAQALLSEGARKWSLTPSANVYYILSGYSHSTLQAIPKSQVDGNTDEKGNSQ